MPYFTGVGLKVKNYRCFTGEEFQGIDDIKHVNVIIGKNNAGKSAFMTFLKDVLNGVFNPPLKASFPYQIEISRFLPNPEYQDIKDLQIHPNLFKLVKDERAKFIISSKEEEKDTPQGRKVSVELVTKAHTLNNGTVMSFEQALFEGVYYVKSSQISAERNIAPESVGSPKTPQPNGDGATNFMRSLKSSLEFKRVDIVKDFLNSLNQILGPDANFNSYSLREKIDHLQEVHFEENGLEDEVSISDMGSGVRTVILTLLATQLIKYQNTKADASRYFYFFEELENNLHPAIQRRLFKYLYDFSHLHNCPIFLSTHSSVAIEFFHNDSDAQIIQVQREKGVSTISTVKNLQASHGLLDDLGVRASDLLQSNCVVWVEGPSDRIYFNRWMELISKGQAQEGLQYQCLFYGGRLRSHLDALPTGENLNDLIKLIHINRNFVFVTDSDVKKEGGELDATKTRLMDECKKAKARFWATDGREIENYIPKRVFAKIYGQGNWDEEVGQLEGIGDYLHKRHPDSGDLKDKETQPVLKDKVDFAKKVCKAMEKEDLVEGSDLKGRLEDVWNYIKQCNGL